MRNDDTVLIAPTGTEPGLVRHFCYKCGKTWEETLEALGYPFSERQILLKSAEENKENENSGEEQASAPKRGITAE